MPKEFVNPPRLPNWSRSFTQVVVTSGAGRTIYISGQVSVDENQNLVGGADLAMQALRAFQNLKTALASVDARPCDVMKLNIYVRNYKPEDADIIGDAMREVFQLENLPASTWIGVQALAKTEFLIEVDAIAFVNTE